MTHRLTTNYAKNYCNRTHIVKVIVENVVTCFLGHGVEIYLVKCCIEMMFVRPSVCYVVSKLKNVEVLSTSF